MDPKEESIRKKKRERIFEFMKRRKKKSSTLLIIGFTAILLLGTYFLITITGREANTTEEREGKKFVPLIPVWISIIVGFLVQKPKKMSRSKWQVISLIVASVLAFGLIYVTVFWLRR